MYFHRLKHIEKLSFFLYADLLSHRPFFTITDFWHQLEKLMLVKQELPVILLNIKVIIKSVYYYSEYHLSLPPLH